MEEIDKLIRINKASLVLGYTDSGIAQLLDFYLNLSKNNWRRKGYQYIIQITNIGIDRKSRYLYF